MDKIRILIADDHKMVREGLKAFLMPQDEFEIVGEAKDGAEALVLAQKLRPDVVLLDLIMPQMDGIQATQAIKEAIPMTQILIITSFAEDDKVIGALKAGATGYLLKDSSPDELKNAIINVFAGESSLSPQITKLLVHELNQADHPKPGPANIQSLTARELEILKLVAEGASNQDIANKLSLSVWTVRTHVTHILSKLGLENRTQAALLALKEGVISQDIP